MKDASFYPLVLVAHDREEKLQNGVVSLPSHSRGYGCGWKCERSLAPVEVDEPLSVECSEASTLVGHPECMNAEVIGIRQRPA